jgi:pimeloyl-ACP methyl ester carboxylesterase
MPSNELIPFNNEQLPQGIRSRFIDGVNGLRMHVLEAGAHDQNRPCVVLIHGFPELAYSWRKIMPALAEAGYYVVAPDMRGYGRTTGWQGEFEDDISGFSLCRMAGDVVALASALGVRQVAAIVGHDFGSPVAGCCALIRPDIFRSVVLMSAPFSGPLTVPFATGTITNASGDSASTQSKDQNSAKYSTQDSLPEALAKLPHPRKHYQWYYSGPDANSEMMNSLGGLPVFFRNYYHHKSADWAGNKVFALTAPIAEEFAKLPTYYVMDLNKGMAETVAEEAPTDQQVRDCSWLTATDIEVYASEYARGGFQGALQCYRCNTGGRNAAELAAYSGRTIDIPSLFIAGASDWGVQQFPGDLDTLTTRFCTQMMGVHLIDGAGHWVQQEQPEAVIALLLEFLN